MDIIADTAGTDPGKAYRSGKTGGSTTPEPGGGPRPLLAACHDCGLVQIVPALEDGETAGCVRCGSSLFGRRQDSIDRSLALNLSALVLFGIANTFPLMTLVMAGQAESTSLAKGVSALFHAGMWGLSILVALVAIVIPLLKILGSIYVLAEVKAGRASRRVAWVFRNIERMHPWAMIEVYLLGLIVAWVKLRDLATLHLDVALFALIGLIITMIWAESALEPHEIWERIAPQRRAMGDAEDQGVLGCHACGQLVDHAHHDRPCPRCGAAIHARKPNSMSRTLALMLAAMLLYAPANILPVMKVVSLGHGEADTILSGVKALISVGMWPVAALVFFASITVPVLKLTGLGYLLISTGRGAKARRRQRTKLYRIIEAVGRWSMVDIFMISILVALVNLGELAQIEPGLGAAAFAAVVTLTMLASASFDPRLIWDRAEGVTRAARG